MSIQALPSLSGERSISGPPRIVSQEPGPRRTVRLDVEAHCKDAVGEETTVRVRVVVNAAGDVVSAHATNEAGPEEREINALLEQL